MKSTHIILAVLLVLGAGGVVTAAGDTGPKAAPEPSPMMQEIQANFDAARVEVAELLKRYEAAISNEEKQEIMQAAALVKLDCRIEMMRIQLRYALERGDEELVAELEQIVTRMTTPPAKGVPAPRREHE